MGSRLSSIQELSRFSSIQKSSKMMLLRPALALLPLLFSCGFSAHISSTTEMAWLNPCSLKLDCPEGSSSQTVNGECQCVPTGSPTGMRKTTSTHMSSTTEMPLHAVLQLASLTALKFRSLACSLKLKFDCPEGSSGQLLTKNGFCQCVPTGSPTGMRKKRGAHMSSTTEMPHMSSTSEEPWLNPCSLTHKCTDGSTSQLVNEECQCVSPGIPRAKRSTSVDCGGHYAPSCQECPQGKRAGWCNGECMWLEKPIKIGTRSDKNCVPRKGPL